jgi:hypothetical protein
MQNNYFQKSIKLEKNLKLIIYKNYFTHSISLILRRIIIYIVFFHYFVKIFEINNAIIIAISLQQ